MKQSITKILITFIISVMSTDAFGYYYDIVVENADGVSIYYKYINGGTELEVSEGDKQYADEVNIPEEITFENNQTLQYGRTWSLPLEKEPFLVVTSYLR